MGAKRLTWLSGWLSASALVCGSALSAQATTRNQAIVLVNRQPVLRAVSVRQGDLYLHQGGVMTRLTTYGQNDAPVLSLDGRYVAYSSQPVELVAARKTTGSALGWIAPQIANIWVMDLNTRKAVQVAAQPTAFQVLEGGRTRNYVERSQPAITQSGAYFAWFEKPNDDFKACAVVFYDIKTKQKLTINIGRLGPVGCLANGGSYNNLIASQGDTFLIYDEVDLLVVSPRFAKLFSLSGNHR